MRHRIFLHVVWTTRDREKLLTAALADFLEGFLGAVAVQEHATMLAFGAVQTHVHLVVRVKPTTDIPRLLQRWKGGSGVIAARERIAASGYLRWEKGYSMDSVSSRGLGHAIAYVLHQAERHPDEAIPGWTPSRLRGVASEPAASGSIRTAKAAARQYG